MIVIVIATILFARVSANKMTAVEEKDYEVEDVNRMDDEISTE